LRGALDFLEADLRDLLLTLTPAFLSLAWRLDFLIPEYLTPLSLASFWSWETVNDLFALDLRDDFTRIDFVADFILLIMRK
jgi:hypothetical protein